MTLRHEMIKGTDAQMLSAEVWWITEMLGLTYLILLKSTANSGNIMTQLRSWWKYTLKPKNKGIFGYNSIILRKYRPLSLHKFRLTQICLRRRFWTFLLPVLEVLFCYFPIIVCALKPRLTFSFNVAFSKDRYLQKNHAPKFYEFFLFRHYCILVWC